MNRLVFVRSSFFSILITIFLLNACQVSSEITITEQHNSTPLLPEIETQQSLVTSTPGVIDNNTGESSNGPWLLFKDDANPDQLLSLLDISTRNIEVLSIPPKFAFSNLSKITSPIASKFILKADSSISLLYQNLTVFNYLENKTEFEIPLSSFKEIDFSSLYETLPDMMKQIMLERNYGKWMINESAANSLRNFQWANNGNSIYFSKIGEDGYSHLFLYDLISGNTSQLESESYFLDSFKSSPDNSSFLVVKSLLCQIPDFPIKSVFVLTINGEMIRLPYTELEPGTILNYSWFDSDNILVSAFDSIEFSYKSLGYFNLPNKQYHEITTTNFDRLLQLNDQVILLSSNAIEGKSFLDIYKLNYAEQSFTINDKCANISTSPITCCPLIITCDQNLYSMGTDFSIEKLQNPSGNLIFSPDSQYIINYTNPSIDHQSNLRLLNADFSLIKEFSVAPTRQVFWQPDSQGFLFLSLDGLYLVTIGNGEPTLMYENNTDDYRYLDYVWINP